MSSGAAQNTCKMASATTAESNTTTNANNNSNNNVKNDNGTTGDTVGRRSSAQATAVNFMSKFRDKDTRVLKNLNSVQFMEVWNNYDKDGKLR